MRIWGSYQFDPDQRNSTVELGVPPPPPGVLAKMPPSFSELFGYVLRGHGWGGGHVAEEGGGVMLCR